MIFLPNSFERYVAALRVLNHLLILKNGMTSKRLTALKKIYKAEALYYKNSLSPFLVSEISVSLLSASQILLKEKGEILEFSVNSNGNYLFNKRLFSLVLLELCTACSYIKVAESKVGVFIYFIGKMKNSLPFIKKMKGYYFYEVLSKKGIIVLPFKKTQETPLSTESEWYYIFDKFSPVNLYFQ